MERLANPNRPVRYIFVDFKYPDKQFKKLLEHFRGFKVLAEDNGEYQWNAKVFIVITTSDGHEYIYNRDSKYKDDNIQSYIRKIEDYYKKAGREYNFFSYRDNDKIIDYDQPMIPKSYGRGITEMAKQGFIRAMIAKKPDMNKKVELDVTKMKKPSKYVLKKFGKIVGDEAPQRFEEIEDEERIVNVPRPNRRFIYKEREEAMVEPEFPPRKRRGRPPKDSSMKLVKELKGRLAKSKRMTDPDDE